MATARSAAAPTFLQRLIHVRPQGGEGRSQSTNHAGQSSEEDGEENDSPIEADLVNPGQSLRQPAHAHSQRSRGQKETQNTSSHAQNEALDYRLAKQHPGACSKGETHRNFTAAPDGTNQK